MRCPGVAEGFWSWPYLPPDACPVVTAVPAREAPAFRPRASLCSDSRPPGPSRGSGGSSQGSWGGSSAQKGRTSVMSPPCHGPPTGSGRAGLRRPFDTSGCWTIVYVDWRHPPVVGRWRDGWQDTQGRSHKPGRHRLCVIAGQYTSTRGGRSVARTHARRHWRGVGDVGATVRGHRQGGGCPRMSQAAPIGRRLPSH